MADATREVDDLMMPPDLSRLSGSSSSIFAASSGDFGSVAGGDPALVGADVGFGGIVEDTVVGVTSGTAGTSDTEPGDSSVSQGPKHASVYMHIYSNFPLFVAQSHLSESYVFPQQVSVPSVQLDPSTSHGALTEQVEVRETTVGADSVSPSVSQIG
eukprot:CAMPEP_0201873902 /NCGR_PEP_ID=MMETSP0902-20130614/6281_1 /ASSEMBLY_ACC=CAM_ASM_000551 /TAXON_ID=420261 /ORGANISM="Thalassiosira antarctica, Strain CCMP982" /LENGTH=156 /DNA_ID=CAMNT_0048400619 /DNA_START=240 /DNA_END=710 /DNA_ORIENTATION=+